MDPNWTRYLHASLWSYVKRELQTLGLLVYLEGQSRKDITGPDAKDYVEFRWDGPDAKEVSKDYWILKVKLNFVISSVVNRPDAYTHKRQVGLVQSILRNSISVFKLGTGESDDQSLLGCLQLEVNSREGIETHYFGQFPIIEMEQSTITANYYMSGRF